MLIIYTYYTNTNYILQEFLFSISAVLISKDLKLLTNV